MNEQVKKAISKLKLLGMQIKANNDWAIAIKSGEKYQLFDCDTNKLYEQVYYDIELTEYFAICRYSHDWTNSVHIFIQGKGRILTKYKRLDYPHDSALYDTEVILAINKRNMDQILVNRYGKTYTVPHSIIRSFGPDVSIDVNKKLEGVYDLTASNFYYTNGQVELNRRLIFRVSSNLELLK